MVFNSEFNPYNDFTQNPNASVPTQMNPNQPSSPSPRINTPYNVFTQNPNAFVPTQMNPNQTSSPSSRINTPYNVFTQNPNAFVPTQMNPNQTSSPSPRINNPYNVFTQDPNAFVPTQMNPNQTSLLYPRINNSDMVAHQIQNNMVPLSPFSMPCMVQISDLVCVTNVLTTQTITDRYHAIVQTNSEVTVHLTSVMTYNPTISHPSSYPPNVFDSHYETFPLNPIDYFGSHQDHWTSPPRRELYVPDVGPVKEIHRTIELLTEADGYVKDKGGETEDGERVDWIHNLPYENEGSFICFKCNSLFETPQMLAAHMEFVHLRSETDAEKKRRLEVDHQEVYSKSLKINKDQTGGQSC